MKIIITENPSSEEWNSVLDNETKGNFQQTFEYGEVMKKTNPRTKVMRLLASTNDRPVGIIQGVYRTRFSFGGKLLVGGISGGAPVTCATDEEERMLVVKTLLESVEEYAKRNRILESRVYWTADWGMHKIFDDLHFKLAREIDVFIVDLRKNEDELRKSLAHNMRRKLRQAIESGVSVEEANNRKELATFYQMVRISGERAGFNPPTLREFEAEWEIFNSKNMVKLFMAKLEEKPVAGAFILAHGKTLYATAAGSLKSAWKARPNDYLHWKIIEWGSQQGFHYYSMGSGLTPGLNRWKKEYGGNLVKIYNFDKVFFPRIKKAADILNAIFLASKRVK